MSERPSVARASRVWALGLVSALAAACEPGELVVPRPSPPEHGDVYSFANGCFAIDATPPGSTNTRWLTTSAEGDGYELTATSLEAASRFTLRATDLGSYLLYDAERRYVVAADGVLARESELLSDILLIDDTYESPAEWVLAPSERDPDRFVLQNRASGQYLARVPFAAAPSGIDLVDDVAEAAIVALYPREGCAEFPELTLDAEGEVERVAWDDGSVFGISEIHAHLFTNFGFGGGGIFHGAPFHRLGVEHALPSCEPFHGAQGRRDIVGFGFSGLSDADPDALITAFVTGRTPDPNHLTDGYPTFTDWPNAWNSSTHQTQYYRWIERAYLAGMRLLVAHATTNRVLCEMIVGINAQRVRYSCNDMVAVEREIEEAYNLERYVDAQHGGPGRGWFRIVTSPEEARRVIGEGRLAVLLGIETSNLFDCFLTPPPGMPACDVDHMRRELDRFHELGVRVLFPVHKFDNGFSAGDGDRNVGQIGSFINSGHDSNFVLDCPDSPTVFDRGSVRFGGLNMPRDDYDAPAPHDMSGFADAPLGTLSPFLEQLQSPPLEGDYCQNAGLTPVGEELLREMMRRGMLIEVDHLPRRSFVRAYEMLVEADYPAIGSHGNTNRGLIFELGGVSVTDFGRCGAPDRRGAMGDAIRNRVAEIEAHGGDPWPSLGFDLNGFAGAPRPRFGPNARCGDVPQANPMTYPFPSFAGDVEFQPPHLGERDVDFDTEGFLHLGMLPELIEDARNDGMTDEELEPLFRSAEAYLRMWERAEARGRALSGG
jgi:microsomal dipeptidase-like Zn-dependent dipeptidase